MVGAGTLLPRPTSLARMAWLRSDTCQDDRGPAPSSLTSMLRPLPTASATPTPVRVGDAQAWRTSGDRASNVQPAQAFH